MGKSHKAGSKSARGQSCGNHVHAAGVPTAQAFRQAEPKTSSCEAAGACESRSVASYHPLQWQWLLGILLVVWQLTAECDEVQRWVVRVLTFGLAGFLGLNHQYELLNLTMCLQPLFRVNCRMQGHKVVALVDSGATMSFVSRRWLQQTGLMDRTLGMHESDSNIEVRFADGRLQTISRQLQEQYLVLVNPHTQQQARFRHDFYVIDMQPDLVLGYDWLEKHNPAIDWSKGTMTVAGVRNERNHSRAPPVVIPVVRSGRFARQQSVNRLPAGKPEVLLSALQVKRLLRKRETDAWVAHMSAHVGAEPHPSASAAPAQSPTELKLDGLDVPECIAAVLKEFADVFAEPSGVPPDRGVSHKIELEHSKPIYRRAYRMSTAELQELKRQLTELQEKGWIRPSSSPYGAPVLFVRKKDGTMRAAVDYRMLNAATVKSRYPLPNIQDLFDQVKGAQWFTKLDLFSGYHQVPVHAPDVFKTAIVTRYGQFEYTVMPFGLCNAPATFSTLMNKVFAPHLDDFVLVYLDDILVYSKTLEEHVEHLRKVLAILQKQQLFAKLKKCEFAKPSIDYLGHIISKDGIRTDPAKVAAVLEWPVPTSVHDVRSFLGLCSYYRRFVPKFAEVAAALTDLTRADVRDVKAAWGPKQQAAFEELKRLLTSTPVLRHADSSKPYMLRCDASEFAIGSVLMQEHEGQLHPVAYQSRKLSPAESRYGAYAREMLAVMDALRHFDNYIDGQHVTVESDHEALSWFWQQKHLDKQQARWMAALQAYDLQLRYIQGKANLVADALSRRPDHQVECGAISVASTTLLRQVLQAAKRDQQYQQQLQLAGKGLLPGYEAVSGVLYQVNKKGRSRVVIPASAHALKQLLLHEFHGAYTAGHFGFYKTLRKVSELFWWKGLMADVKAYVSSCVTCLSCKSSTQAPLGLLHSLPVPSEKWDSISMDFVTGLPVTQSGHDAVFVVTDRLTKMVVLIPTVTTLTAPRAAELFMRHVFAHYGLPRSIVSDRDSRFLSAFWKALFKSLGTKLAYSSAYHPQTDGQTERVNQTMEQVLRVFSVQRPAEWDTHLHMCQFVLNAAEHVSSGFSPFQLMYGYEPRVPATLAAAQSPVPAADEMLSDLTRQLRAAQHQLLKARERQTRYANQRRREHVFAVGDEVMLSTKHLSAFDVPGKKLLRKYVGPFKVAAVINPVAVRLALPQNLSRIHPVFHVSMLKPVPPGGAVWHADSEVPVDDTPIPLPAAAKRVEFVIGHDLLHTHDYSGVLYLVKWKDVPSWDATLESEADVLAVDPSAAELLREYRELRIPVLGVDTHLPPLPSDDELEEV
jgi:transposase InsO family protein